MTPRLTPEGRRLLERQRGLIADWQAPSVDLSRRRLVRATNSGWHQVTPHVFCSSDADISPAQLRQAGSLEAGPDAVLTGRSALLEAGWTGKGDDHVDVLVPRDNRWRSRCSVPWLRLHFPGSLPWSTGRPARTTPARATIDAATWAVSAREVLFLILSPAQQRLCTPQQLLKEFERRSRVRHRRAIAEALAEMELGATSTSEADFLRECRRRRLPTPKMQTRRRAGGRTRVTDAEFRLSDGRLVIVEIDGIGHLDVATWHADISRHNDLTASTGALILRVTGWEVRHDPEPFFDVLCQVVFP